MYTEVREVVNFICRYLFGQIPRRPVGIFAAELGNFLVSQFSSSWDIHHSQNGELERMIVAHCSVEGTSKCFVSCAIESGVDPVDILRLLPGQLRFFVNPGQVYFRASEQGMNFPIWTGDVNADALYQPVPEYIVRSASSRAEKCSNLGAAGKPVIVGRKQLPCNDNAVIELVNTMYTPLGLEKCDEINSSLYHLQEKYPYRFVYKPSSAQTFTGIEFSQTRFGSSKSRPDLQTMLAIRQHTTQNTTSSISYTSPNNDPLAYSHY